MLFSQWLHCLTGRMSAASHRRFAGRRGSSRRLSPATYFAGWSVAPKREIACGLGGSIERFEDRALLVTGTFAFSVAPSSAAESTTTRTVNVQLTSSAALGAGDTMSVEVNLGGGGTATGGGVDFTYANTTLTFTSADVTGAGTFTKSVDVTIAGDQRLEGDESVNLILANQTASNGGDTANIGSPSTRAVVITDDETGVINFLADAAAAESVDSTQNATLAITGIGTGTVGLDVALTVAATQTGGTATSGTDYAAYGSQTLTFSTGDGTTITSSNATLDVTSDQRLEGNETVNLSIGSLSSSLSGQVTLSDTTHTATITDDETGVINFLADAAAAESVDPTQGIRRSWR